MVTEDRIPRIKHYLIDCGAIIGSDSTEAKGPRAGHEYLYLTRVLVERQQKDRTLVLRQSAPPRRLRHPRRTARVRRSRREVLIRGVADIQGPLVAVRQRQW